MVQPLFIAKMLKPRSETFLNLIEKHFPRHNRLYKIFNRNTPKLSYSSMSNISTIIKQHNCKVLSTKIVDWLCSSRNKDSCPFDGECLQTCIVYKADVVTNKESHIYYGASDGEFKFRLSNHTNLFRNQHQKQGTEL